jgi:hypothetical protein
MRRIAVSLVLLCLPALLGAVTSPGVAEESSPAGTKTFGGWTGTCNNLGACVAIGTTEADMFFYARIAREAGATAAPQVKLVLAAQDKLSGTGPAFKLTAKGRGTAISLGPYPATSDPADMTQFTATLAPVDRSLAFIEATRNADTLDYEVLGAKGTLDLKGLSATLRWIDAQQGRAGTPTALVARGMTPIGQVPEPREAPTVTAAPAGSVSQITKPTASQPVLDAAMAIGDCEKETVQAHQDLETWRLGPDRLLVVVPCSSGAYNFTSALYYTDAKGLGPKAVALPQPPGATADMAPNVIINAAFDPNTMVLSEFAKGRGIGDCGALRNWVWTGERFALLDVSTIDVCPGALPEDWPNLYTARRR